MIEVTLEEFFSEIEKENEYLQMSTTYRKETAKQASYVLKAVQDVNPFFKRDEALDCVSKVLYAANLERQRDVAKMLNVILNDLYLTKNMSTELEEHLANRRKNRGPVKLVLSK